jgi:tryptophan-rich sensory protein
MLGIPLTAWAIGCLVLAGVYVFVWPRPRTEEEAARRPVWRHVVLRWLHPGIWLVLGASFAVRAAPIAEAASIGNQIASLAFILYIVYIVVYLADRKG